MESASSSLARYPPPSGPALLTPQPDQAQVLTSWRYFFAGVFDIAAEDAGAVDSAADLSARSTPNFVLSQAQLPESRLFRSPATISKRGGDCFAVRLLLSGEIAGRMGDRTIEARAGDVMFIDLAQTLDLQISAADAEAGDISFWISRPRMLASFGDERALHGFVLAGGSTTGALIGGALRLFAQQTERLTTQEMDALADGLVELIARSVAPLLAQAGGANGGAPLASFVTIRRYIDQNLRSPALNANRLAKTFGLSPASLYRLFKPVGGVATYIRKARLNRAYQEIVSAELANRRIGPIAYRCGFKNLSAFDRLFKETYGVSPSEARGKAPERLESVDDAAASGDGRSLAFWLARLSGARAAVAKA